MTHACPACNAALRAFSGRLVCDACEGIFCTEADLVTSLNEFTGIECTVTHEDVRAGLRRCPTCATAMSEGRLRLGFAVIDKQPRTPPRVDRCATHGIWFDKDELAAVLEVASRVASPGGGGSGGGTGTSPGSRNFGIGGRAWALTSR